MRRKVVAFDHSFKRLDSLNSHKIRALYELIREKDRQIATGHMAYLDMKATVETSLEETRSCVDKFNSLQKKHNRQYRQNKVWQTATFILSGVIIIGASL